MDEGRQRYAFRNAGREAAALRTPNPLVPRKGDDHAIPYRPALLPPLDAQRHSPRLIESHYENNYGGTLAA